MSTAVTGALKGLLLAAAAVGLSLTNAAHADPVLVGGAAESAFLDLGAQGFGAAPRPLTLQTGGLKGGSVTVPKGDAVRSADKSNTPTLGALGWTSGAQAGIGFNSDQSNTGIRLDSLTLQIHNGTTPVSPAFSQTAPINFTATELGLQKGGGNAVFDFAPTAAEQTEFNTILAMSGSSLAMSGSSGFFAGLSSTLGCATGAPTTCEPSDAGPDSFLGFARSAVAAPLPGAIFLFGSVLFGGLGMSTRRARRRNRGAVSLLA
jgi:hypothetical protein